MADYRLIMALLLQEQPYRQIQVMAGCSHRAISRARRVLDAEHLTTPEQIHALTAEDLERFFTDGRRSVTGEFVPIDIDKVIAESIQNRIVSNAEIVQLNGPNMRRHTAAAQDLPES